MDKKIVRRILSVSVFIALVIIVLPVVCSGNSPQLFLREAEVKEPPFPNPKLTTTATIPVQPKLYAATPIVKTALEAKQAASPVESNVVFSVDKHKDLVVSRPVPAVVASNEEDGSDINPPADEIKAVAMRELKSAQPKVEKAKPTVSKHSEEMAWVIQVGIFKNKENADHLVNKLQAKGYDVYAREGKRGNHTLVYVQGTNQTSAEAAMDKLYQQTGMRGLIVKG